MLIALVRATPPEIFRKKEYCEMADVADDPGHVADSPSTTV